MNRLWTSCPAPPFGGAAPDGPKDQPARNRGGHARPNRPKLDSFTRPSAFSGERVGGRPDFFCGRGNRKGFTLVELAILLALVGIVIAVALPMIEESENAANNARAGGDIRAIEADIDIFEMNNGFLPASLAVVGRAAMVDPWGNPYVYNPFVTTKDSLIRRDRFLKPLNSNYDLYSRGRDGDSRPPLAAEMSLDDIVRANDGGFVGLAKAY